MNNFKYIKLGVLITTLSLAGSLFNACNDDIELPVPNTDKYEDYGVYGYVKQIPIHIFSYSFPKVPMALPQALQ